MKLEAKAVSFRYRSGDRQILNQVSLTVHSGERVGLAAPSGFGKTTLLKILAGYETPDAGQVLLDEQPLAAHGRYCPVQMIWQHPEQVVNPRRRAEAILREGDRLEPRIREALGIEEGWLSRYPGELSGGELQRFCIARALGERTRFLLADEITTMLDLITQSQIWSFLVDEIARRGMGALIVSHSQPLLEHLCTRVVALDSPWVDPRKENLRDPK